MNTRLITLALMCSATVLAGCAGMNSVSNDVYSFGDWPSGRAPGSFAFDRLPSQQALGEETDRVEAAARPALERAGFVPAAQGQSPDVLVQVGARSTRSDRGVWDDPFWWRGGFGYSRHGPWFGPSWGWQARYDMPRVQREVAVLIRDRASGKPIFEARATNETMISTDAETLSAMFEATLVDFPRLGVNPRRVVVPVGQ